MARKKKIVVIGGGTGTFTVLSGLKKYPSLDLSVVVSMMDDGGSNRVIRDEFGILPTSDLRQCMVALASDDADEIIRNLFTYRYNAGTGISGMTFGNLFMAALTDIYNSQERAIEETCKLLRVVGQIVPVTNEKTHLVARYANGKQVLGEHDIDEPDEETGNYRIVELEVFPKVRVSKKAVHLIKAADLIVLGPGDLYTSILANVVVDDLASVIKKSKAKKVYVLNLMSKFGQTNGMKASGLVSEVEKYIKCPLDFVLVNNSKKYPSGILKKYKEEKAAPIEDDLGNQKKTKIVRRSLVSNKVFEKPKSDKLIRSLIRHDSDKLAKTIVDILS